MSDYYPPGTPSDFLMEDVHEMIETFDGGKIDIQDKHWMTEEWGAVPAGSLSRFVHYLHEEELDMLEEIIYHYLDETYKMKGG